MPRSKYADLDPIPDVTMDPQMQDDLIKVIENFGQCKDDDVVLTASYLAALHWIRQLVDSIPNPDPDQALFILAEIRVEVQKALDPS